MKGLMIKDFYCLKKNSTEFLCVCIGVIVVGVMYFLSMEYGNMKGVVEAQLLSTMEQLESESATDRGMARFATEIFTAGPMCMITILPLVLFSNALMAFQDDEKAGFGKLTLSMPLSLHEIVGARYAVVLLYSLLSLGASLLSLGLVALTTDVVKFGTAMGMCLSIYSLLLLLCAVNMFELFAFRMKDIERIVTYTVMPFCIVFSIAFLVITLRNPELCNKIIVLVMEKGEIFLNKGYVYTLPAAIVALTGSYFGSVWVIGKRKGAVL